ncbi:Glucan endo-1,3-beta-glucosidase, acidic isoform GL153 [Linum perenne]
MAQSPNIGVCNGRVANNLPTEADVVAFYNTNGITKMRIYDADQLTLQALKGTNIQLILDATAWVQTNILSYYPAVNFSYISVGNEIGTTDPIAPSVLPAITNIASSYIVPIVQYLANNGAPLLANVYPYFAYISNPAQIDLKYSTFGTSGQTVVHDGPYSYTNLFHAMIDSIHAALEKVAAPVEVVVSETGWPSDGGVGATVENASAYYSGLTSGTVTSGTPRKPGQPIETYLFAMFDENQKPGAASEQHFGIFTPDKQPKYPVKFH